MKYHPQHCGTVIKKLCFGALTALLVIAFGAVGGVSNLGMPDSVQAAVPGAASSTPTLTVTPTGAPTLMAAKLVDKDQALPGDVLHYTLVVLNDDLSGEDPGTSVQLVDPLPDTLELIPGSLSENATYDADTRTILWSGQVPRGGNIAVTFQARLTPEAANWQSISNTMVVTDAFGREKEASAQTHVIHPGETATPTCTAAPPCVFHHSFLPLVLREPA